MEQKITLKQLREDFNQSLEQELGQFKEQLKEKYRQAQVEQLYYFIKFSLPRELGEWINREMGHYDARMSISLFQFIKEEEREKDCHACEHHSQMSKRIKSRISNPPQVIEPQLGVNNVFHQGFGAFGFKGGLTYLGISFLPFEGMWFEVAHIAIPLTVGVFSGVRAYRKYAAMYREQLLEISEGFIAENRQRFQEWFDQIIYFSEEEREICRR